MGSKSKLIIKTFSNPFKIFWERQEYGVCEDLEQTFSIVMGSLERKKIKGIKQDIVNKNKNRGIFIFHEGALIGLLKIYGQNTILSFHSPKNKVQGLKEFGTYFLEKKTRSKLWSRGLKQLVENRHRILRVNFKGKLILRELIFPVNSTLQKKGHRLYQEHSHKLSEYVAAQEVMYNPEELAQKRDYLIAYLKEERKKAGSDELFFDYIIKL